MCVVPRITDDLESVSTPHLKGTGSQPYQHAGDEEQNVRHRRTWPIKPSEHHERKESTAHGSQSVGVPPTKSSGNVPTMMVSN